MILIIENEKKKPESQTDVYLIYLTKEADGLIQRQLSVRKSLVVAFVEDNATLSSIRYFENHVTYFVQNRRK